MSTSNTLVSGDSPRSSASQDSRHFVDLEASRNTTIPRRKGSTASNASRQRAEDEIYPDMTEEQRNLKRTQTLEEVKKIYSRKHNADGELDAPDDAGSLVDVDPELVTWDGPDDPQNPRNFPDGKKWGITMVISLYTFVTPFASSVVAPAAMVYGREFGITNSTILSMSVSIFLLGFAVGPLFFAPLSEMYGRLIVMHVSTFFFLAFTIGTSFSGNTETMIILRFLSGLSGSAPLALGAGVLSDVWAPMDLARASAVFSLGPLIGPITAPIMSGFVIQYLEWRWVFWILTLVVGFTAILGLFIYRTETYAVVILNRRAARMRKETGNPHLHTVFEIGTRDFKTTLKIAIVRPFKMLVTNPALFLLGLFMAFVYGFLYLMFVTFPTLFQGVYSETSGMAGLNYLGPGVGFFLGIGIFTPLMQMNYKRLTEANGGVAKPEFRLPVIFFGAVLIPGGLFWYGWSAEYHIHWIMPLIGSALFCAGMMSVFMAVQTYLIDMSPRYAASAVSAATVFRSLFGFAFPLFGGKLYEKLGYGWGNSLLAFIAIPLGLVFPMIIYKYGEPWRIAAEARLDRSEQKVGDRADARNEKRNNEKLSHV
ncbi:major facilitator superfamily domain-containing protein [Peziza echinospora]|nr:major facilitator superfamily domain-containing protein [Peziza echinospora]